MLEPMYHELACGKRLMLARAFTSSLQALSASLVATRDFTPSFSILKMIDAIQFPCISIILGPFAKAVGAWRLYGRNIFGNPLTVIPRLVDTPSLQRSPRIIPSVSLRPKRFKPPVKASNPVATAIISISCKFPSAVTIPSGRTSTTGFLLVSMMWTLGLSTCS